MLKTSELTGAALDWAVAECEGQETEILKAPALLQVYVKRKLGAPYRFNPSTDWAQGGPIIEREDITILFHDGYISIPNTWFACKDFYYDGIEISDKYSYQGNTPLIAAMRCYVASKMGDEVAVPEELCE